MTVNNLKLSTGGNVIEWTSSRGLIRKIYKGTAKAISLASGSGVLVIEPYENDPDNVVIFNEDGTERVRVSNPLKSRGAICFSEAGYEHGELTIIARLRGLEVACVLDEHGLILRQHEIR